MLKYFRRPHWLRNFISRKIFNNYNYETTKIYGLKVTCKSLESECVRMFIRSSKDSLPDPKRLLSSSLPSKAIAFANKEVEKVTTSENSKKHIDIERCGAPSHTSALLEIAASHRHGSHERSKLSHSSMLMSLTHSSTSCALLKLTFGIYLT